MARGRSVPYLSGVSELRTTIIRDCCPSACVSRGTGTRERLRLWFAGSTDMGKSSEGAPRREDWLDTDPPAAWLCPFDKGPCRAAHLLDNGEPPPTNGSDDEAQSGSISTARATEANTEEQDSKSCFCGVGPCIGQKELRRGYVCSRESAASVLRFAREEIARLRDEVARLEVSRDMWRSGQFSQGERADKAEAEVERLTSERNALRVVGVAQRSCGKGCAAALRYEHTANGIEYWRCPVCGNPHWGGM